MFAELVKKRLSSEQIVALIRKRHQLADDTPVVVKTFAMVAEMEPGDPHKFKARITTESLDRDDEVVVPQGMDATEFEKSGAIFWNHNYDLPIAAAGQLVRGEGAVDAFATFAKRPDDYQGEFFPDFARAMVQQRIVKGVSIGFIPMEGRSPSKKDMERYGERCRKVWSKWKLLEWSVAPVQSNPDAVITEAIAKGLIPGEGVSVTRAFDVRGISDEEARDLLPLYGSELPKKPRKTIVRELEFARKARPNHGKAMDFAMQKAKGVIYAR